MSGNAYEPGPEFRQDYLNSLINNINELFYTYDLSGCISFVNNRCLDFLGYRPEEAIGKYLWDFVPDDYRETFIRLFTERIARGTTQPVVLTLVHKNGTEMVFRINEAPIVENGQRIGEMALAEDITARIKAQRELKESNQALERLKEELTAANQQLIAHEEELIQQLDEIAKNKEALARSEERYREIMESIQDGYFETDLAGNFIFLNRALHEYVGYSEQEMLGSNYRQVMDETNANRVFKIFNRVYRTGKAVEHFGWYVLKRDGDSLYVECTVLPIIKAHEIVGFRGIIRELSQRHNAELALRYSENLYRTIFENTGTATLIMDEDMTISLMNGEMVKLSGYSREEVENKHKWDLLVHEADRLRMREYHYARRQGRTDVPNKYDFLFVTKEGEIRNIVMMVALIPETSQSVASLLDVTDMKKAEQQLKDSEIKLRKQVDYLNTLINNLNELFFTYDSQGRFEYVNKKIKELLGYSPEELLGRNVTEYVRADMRSYVQENIISRLKEQTNNSYELPVIAKNQEIRIIRLNSSPIYEDGKVVGGMVLADDITDRKQAELQLIMSEARYRAIVEDQTELICRFLADRTLTFVNETFCRYFQLQRRQLLGQKFAINMHPDDNELFWEKINDLTPGQPVTTVQIRVFLPDLRMRWQQWTHRAIFSQETGLIEYQSVGRDITEQKEAEEKIKFFSMHDALTGIYNRLFFEQELKKRNSERYQRLGLIICDVDGLKLINDTLGHEKGDQLIIAAAKVLSRCFRGDDVVARIGGDEFAALLPGADQELAMRRIEQVREAIRQHNKNNPEMYLSLSMGCAVRTDHTANMNELYRQADNNMYRNKMQSSQQVRQIIVQQLIASQQDLNLTDQARHEYFQQLVNDMADRLNLGDEQRKTLNLLACYRDMGYAGVSQDLLLKPEVLLPEEYAEIKRHCDIGQRIALYTPDLVDIADFILKHHEWWNGQGYPLGLKGDEIPLECRIIAIIDAYMAMTGDRPYRSSLSQSKALAELQHCAGSQFDPGLVETFIKVIRKED